MVMFACSLKPLGGPQSWGTLIFLIPGKIGSCKNPQQEGDIYQGIDFVPSNLIII